MMMKLDPKTQKRILYAVGWTLALIGGGLIQQHVVTGDWVEVATAMAWVGGWLKGKASPAPGAGADIGKEG
jgi:hypothetical protein